MSLKWLCPLAFFLSLRLTGCVCARLHAPVRSPGGDMGAKKKKKKQKRKKEKPSSGGAKSDSASDSQEIKVKQTKKMLASGLFVFLGF